MYRAEFSFDPRIEQKRLESLCKKTDKLFEAEGILCEKTAFGKRIYCTDGSGKNDFARMWAAIFGMKDDIKIADALVTAIWQHNDIRENMIGEFFLCE